MSQQPTLTERIEELRVLNLQLRHQLEVAEVQIPIINQTLKQLASIELAPKHVILGPVIFERPYGPGDGAGDSAQVVQAALIANRGLGVVLWDLDEYKRFRNDPAPDYDAISRRFVDFDENDLATKALLMAVTGELVNRVCRQIVPPGRS